MNSGIVDSSLLKFLYSGEYFGEVTITDAVRWGESGHDAIGVLQVMYLRVATAPLPVT